MTQSGQVGKQKKAAERSFDKDRRWSMATLVLCVMGPVLLDAVVHYC